MNLEQLLLSNSHLSGLILSEIGVLVELCHINMVSYAFLSGTISSEIANIGRLEAIDLRGNDLSTGSIPDDL